MKKIYLIDGNSFIYRMFFALPEFTSSDGTYVNALFGMAKFFMGQLIKENPDYLVFIKDAKGKNFRHDIYSEYKTTREKMPDNLKTQISLIEDMIQKMGFEIIEIPNCEADDVIGTLATKLQDDKENDIYILSGDKDLYSLTTKNVKIYDTMKNKIYDNEKTKEKFKINPEYITDYLAIVGDSSDNIPGVAGFGPKKVEMLINTYRGVENIFNHIDDKDFIFSGKTKEKLIAGKENAFLSKKLATIKKDIEFEFNLKNFCFNKDNILNEEVKKIFKKYEFNSLYKEEKNLKTWQDLNLKVKIITSKKELENLKNIIKNYSKIFLDTETTSLNVMKAQLVGISIYLDEKSIFYINCGHTNEKKVESKDIKDFINYLFNLQIEIIGHNLKYDLEIIELFLNKENIKKEDNNFGQMSLEI